MAAPENSLMFFKECAAASEKYFKKCATAFEYIFYVEENVRLLLRIRST